MSSDELSIDGIPSRLDFTYSAREQFYDAADDPYFQKSDTKVIYTLLQEKMRIIPFGDFLKRYIYHKAHITGEFSEVPVKRYVDTICAEFESRKTPCSFTPTSVRPRNAARNWLEQKSVNRNVVLILGFGLGMSVEDVNRFLTKALQEPALNAKAPFEAICWYCYREHLEYNRFEELWERFKKWDGEHGYRVLENLDRTAVFGQRFSGIHSEQELDVYLKGLPYAKGTKLQSITTRQSFDTLYHEAREHVARILTKSAQDDAQIAANRLADLLSRNDQLNDAQRRDRIRRAAEQYPVYKAENISPGEFECVLYAAVPRDRHGNMLPVKNSTLNEQFAGRRLNRQHIFEILSGDASITRYDLITVSFFNHTQADGIKPRQRYSGFIEATNRMLRFCGMEPLYVVNPYECFLLMCMLADDPLGTFADVWERSYSGE